jgi:hypothetical protein
MVWNVHTSFPVTMSNARRSPGGEPYPSPVVEPVMYRFSKTRPGVPLGPPSARGVPSRMLTRPFTPKVRIGAPVRASIAHNAPLEPKINRPSDRSLLSQ